MATKTKKKGASDNLSHAKLVGLIAGSTDLSRADVSRVMRSLVDHIYSAMDHGKVTITGLGSFSIRTTKARTMKSALLGGKTVKVPAKRKPTFRPAKAFRDL